MFSETRPELDSYCMYVYVCMYWDSKYPFGNRKISVTCLVEHITQLPPTLEGLSLKPR